MGLFENQMFLYVHNMSLFGIDLFLVQKLIGTNEWFSVASINIQTLARVGKRSALAGQCRKAKIAIIAMHETRSKRDTDYVADGWYFVDSKAIEGDYGEDLWIDLRTTVGYRNDTKLKIPREAVTVWFRHPRLVVVLVHVEAWAIWVVAGHIPLSNMEDWWTMVREVLSHPKLTDLEMVWLVDANGRIAKDAVKNRVGPVHDGLLEVMTNSVVCNNISRGLLFGGGLIEHNMWAPSKLAVKRNKCV